MSWLKDINLYKTVKHILIIYIFFKSHKQISLASKYRHLLHLFLVSVFNVDKASCWSSDIPAFSFLISPALYLSALPSSHLLNVLSAYFDKWGGFFICRYRTFSNSWYFPGKIQSCPQALICSALSPACPSLPSFSLHKPFPFEKLNDLLFFNSRSRGHWWVIRAFLNAHTKTPVLKE